MSARGSKLPISWHARKLSASMTSARCRCQRSSGRVARTAWAAYSGAGRGFFGWPRPREHGGGASAATCPSSGGVPHRCGRTVLLPGYFIPLQAGIAHPKHLHKNSRQSLPKLISPHSAPGACVGEVVFASQRIIAARELRGGQNVFLPKSHTSVSDCLREGRGSADCRSCMTA